MGFDSAVSTVLFEFAYLILSVRIGGQVEVWKLENRFNLFYFFDVYLHFMLFEEI